jgi:hypothetical protein
MIPPAHHQRPLAACLRRVALAVIAVVVVAIAGGVTTG